VRSIHREYTSSAEVVPLVSGDVTFERVLVVGAGQMGAGIAQVLAASGRIVLLHDAAPGAVEKGLAGIGASLEKLAAKGAPHDPGQVLARIQPADHIADADLMVEAVVEDAAVKRTSSGGPTRRSAPAPSSPRTPRRFPSPCWPRRPPGPTA
jgi:hypothetical protein